MKRKEKLKELKEHIDFLEFYAEEIKRKTHKCMTCGTWIGGDRYQCTKCEKGIPLTQFYDFSRKDGGNFDLSEFRKIEKEIDKELDNL